MNMMRQHPSLSVALTTILLSVSLDGYQVFRYRAKVSYDGTNFNGWQYQGDEGQRTVQQVLNEQLTKRICDPVKVVGASRTDSGVHAKGQVIHFDLKRQLNPEDLQTHLNCNLPSDVKIRDLSQVNEFLFNEAFNEVGAKKQLFHSRLTAVGKIYTYQFCTNRFLDPLRARYCALHSHYTNPMDLNILNKTLQLFVGTHDFKAFGNTARVSRDTRGADELFTPSSMRTINSITLTAENEPGYFFIHFNISSAIYRMIRNIVGASIKVASSSMPLDAVVQLLNDGSERRDNKAPPACASGLCLYQVQYSDGY